VTSSRKRDYSYISQIRDIGIYGLGDEYFEAYCHYRAEVRIFKISRVLWARLSSETYEIPRAYTPSTWVTEGWGDVDDTGLESIETLSVVDGTIEADPSQGINKIAMIDRIFGTGEMGVAFVRGFNIRDGSIGTTANVFNQNIVLIGASDQDMAVAANETIKMGGCFIAVRQGKVAAAFPTPLNGIGTDLPFDEAYKSESRLLQAWRDMGCSLETPQTNLEFVTPVTIPAYKICTKGLALIDGDKYELVSIVV